MMLPDRGWPSYEKALKRLGERRSANGDVGLLGFLVELGLVRHDFGVSRDDYSALTDVGTEYFTARFVTDNSERVAEILHKSVLAYPPAAAISQLLAGVAGANRDRAETILRSQGFAAGLTERALGSLLTLMSTARVIDYVPRRGTLRVLDSAVTTEEVPSSVFISPKTPFGNKVWLRRVLAKCTGHIDWLDKHFMPVAFEALWEAVDGSVIDRVRVLSLRTADHDGKRPIRHYRDLRTELAGRDVVLEWRTIDSTKIRDTHDRWILSADRARNVPNVNAIYTGQNSELNLSGQLPTLQALFDGYWGDSEPFDRGGPDAAA